MDLFGEPGFTPKPSRKTRPVDAKAAPAPAAAPFDPPASPLTRLPPREMSAKSPPSLFEPPATPAMLLPPEFDRGRRDPVWTKLANAATDTRLEFYVSTLWTGAIVESIDSRKVGTASLQADGQIRRGDWQGHAHRRVFLSPDRARALNKLRPLALVPGMDALNSVCLRFGEATWENFDAAMIGLEASRETLMHGRAWPSI